MLRVVRVVACRLFDTTSCVDTYLPRSANLLGRPGCTAPQPRLETLLRRERPQTHAGSTCLLLLQVEGIALGELGIEPCGTALHHLTVDLDTVAPHVGNDATVAIDIPGNDHQPPAPHQIDERQLGFPAIGLAPLRRIDVGETYLHLLLVHAYTQRIAVAHPHERPIENAFLPCTRHASHRLSRALGMAMALARRPIKVTALAIDCTWMRATQQRQYRQDERADHRTTASAPLPTAGRCIWKNGARRGLLLGHDAANHPSARRSYRVL